MQKEYARKQITLLNDNVQRKTTEACQIHQIFSSIKICVRPFENSVNNVGMGEHREQNLFPTCQGESDVCIVKHPIRDKSLKNSILDLKFH